MKKHLYVPIWKKRSQDMFDMLDLRPDGSRIQLDKNDFNAVGNRKSYAFRLEMRNGKIVNNIKGSAVARDLADIMLGNSTYRQFLSSKHVIIRMDQNFSLFLQIV